MEKVLITGGAGFVGSHLTDRLISDGYEVVVLDNLSSGKKENVNPKAKFYKADVVDENISKIFAKEKPDFVFHFAAHIEARVSVQNPLADAKTNILGSLNVLENCRAHKVQKVIFASSGGEVYGDAKQIPTPETYPPRPISPYGVSKFAVEKYLDSYWQLFHLPYASLRFGNIYGPRQNPNGEAGVVAIFAKKMWNQEPVFIHGSGRQTKDYIFIDDAVDATIKAFKKSFVGVVNIGTGKETSVLEIFKAIKKLTGSATKKQHVPLPPTGFPRGALSVAKVKKELGWRPRYKFQEGLQITVRWFQANNPYDK